MFFDILNTKRTLQFPAATVKLMTYIGSENALGNLPNITSRIVPPATPTT